MKKVGILTMHKVINYGSALQAYALQRIISGLGYKTELIDYIFPNSKRNANGKIKTKIINLTARLLTYISIKRKKQRFQSFYNIYFNCTDKQFNSPEELIGFKFDYDILMTGSDQVWNPKHIIDDLSFFLPFANDSVPKISYASSFSTATIPEALSETFKKHLLRYKELSVREKSGVAIIEQLTGRKATFVCDPTLLLNSDCWSILAEKADKEFNIPKKGYILIYLLRYAYDPYPTVINIIEKVQKELQLPIVALDPSLTESKFNNSTNVRDAGPLEFLKLIKNASFVITNSFHGTAFSLNFNIPFYSIIKERGRFDTRMTDLLDRVGAKRDIVYNAQIDKPLKMDYKTININIEDFRNKSKEYLRQTLKAI